MKPEQISPSLTHLFPDAIVEQPTPETWQVERPPMRLLVILSADSTWLRVLLPIAPWQEAKMYAEQLLEANFDVTQATRYAVSQGVLWGVYHHYLESLTEQDFNEAIATLIVLREQGLSESFNQLVEQRLREIVKAAKMQNQDLETTLKSVERFYAEGILGGLDQSPAERDRFLQAWNAQLKRLWQEIDT